MTTETVVHPRILMASADLTSRLQALEYEPGEVVIMARIVVRNGIPRLIKWSKEETTAYPS